MITLRFIFFLTGKEHKQKENDVERVRNERNGDLSHSLTQILLQITYFAVIGQHHACLCKKSSFDNRGEIDGPLSHIPGICFDPPLGCVCGNNREK
ncbi:unnamed protein product [Adineta ricciae]|uniref:Uncharacterized protein n=1 Tax=Adineta ricciae TaxID=249248 RepID=A0A815VYJ1_ADIRI|nr:unnamed protein product [Adineta ricciae]